MKDLSFSRIEGAMRSIHPSGLLVVMATALSVGFGCDKSNSKGGGDAQADEKSSSSHASGESSDESPGLVDSVPDSTCDVLTKSVVSEAFDIDPSKVKKKDTVSSECLYKWRSDKPDGKRLTANLMTIDDWENEKGAKKGYRQKIPPGAHPPDDGGDAQTGGSGAEKVGEKIREVNVLDDVGDAAFFNGMGILWVRHANVVFGVSAFYGPKKKPPPEGASLEEVKEADRKYREEIRDDKREDSAALARAIIEHL